MLKRRSLLAGALVAQPVLALTAAAQAKKPILVFAGDEASEGTRTWRSQWEPMFKQSPVFQKIDYRVVFTKTPAELMKPANWPSDLRWVLDAYLMSQVGVDQGSETPRFFLIQDGQITFTAVGNNSWRDVMWPTLLDVTNSSP